MAMKGARLKISKMPKEMTVGELSVRLMLVLKQIAFWISISKQHHAKLPHKYKEIELMATSPWMLLISAIRVCGFRFDWSING